MNNTGDDGKYRMLIDAATEALRRNYHAVRHSVGAAVWCASGRIYTGINVEASGYGVCAEPIALGAALTNGERSILAVVAVCKREEGYVVLSPCGNCRQLLLDYAPEADVVYMEGGRISSTRAKNLLPGAYVSPDFDDI